MISKIFYMNDEQKHVVVRVLDLRYDASIGKGDLYVTLQSCEAQVFEVHLPVDHILYVKKWSGMVLISHVDPSVVAQRPESQRREDVK
jgi:RNA polymerase subunit RPABC4/transcription elongation factor Spt4